MKGKAEPLALFRPLAARARFGSDVTRTHTTPLVGRELEKPLLIGTFERSAQQRSCQLVTIVGEPGVGKSRLCAELFGYIEERPGLVTLAAGPLPALRGGDRLLGARGDRQGRVRHPRVGLARGGRGQARARRCPRTTPTAPGSGPGSPRSSGAGGEPASQEESFTAWRRFLRGAGREGARRCSSSRTCTGPTTPCSSFLEHLADWSRGRAAARALHGPSGAVRAASDLGGRAAERDNGSTSPR